MYLEINSKLSLEGREVNEIERARRKAKEIRSKVTTFILFFCIDYVNLYNDKNDFVL